MLNTLANNKYKIICILVCLVYVFTFFFFKNFDTDWVHTSIGFPVAPGDSAAYYQLAQNILSYHHFSFSHSAPFIPESFRSPGYPTFVALILLFFKSAVFVSIIQCLLSLITSLLIFDIVKTLTSRRVALFASLLFALNPSTLFYSISLLSDILFVFLEVLAFWLIYKKQSIAPHIIAFIFLGIAALVRPAGSYLAFIFVFGYIALYIKDFGVKKSITVATVLLLTTLIVVSPWMYRNYKEYKSFSISSIGPYTLLFFDMESFHITHGKKENQIEQEWLSALNLKTREEAYSPYHSKKITEILLQELSKNYLSYSLFHLTGSARFFLVSGTSDVMNNTPRLNVIISHYNLKSFLQGALWVERFLYLIITILLVISPYIAYRKKESKWGVLFLTLGISIYIAFVIGPIPNARYRLSILPFMLIGASYSLYTISKHKLLIQKITPNRNNSRNDNL